MGFTGVALVAAGMLSLAGLPFAMAWVEEVLMTTTRGSHHAEPSDVHRV